MATAPVSVIVTCYADERWDYLLRAIDSAARQEPAPAEIVVVADNNTRLFERLREEVAGVTLVSNPNPPGASNARNAGAAVTSTPFIAFLDDDVEAHAGWLERLLAPFDDEGVVGTGGRADPRWQVRRPRWFPDEFAWVVGTSYTGMPLERQAVRNVWSENMAVRGEVFHAVGGFRGDFGKVASVSRPEDTDLCIRMSSHAPGGRWVFVPDAVVDHEVPAARATLRYFLRRSFWEGRGKIEMARAVGREQGLSDERAWLTKTVPAGVLRNLREAARDGSTDGIPRAAAIVAGIIAAGVGAAVSLSLSWRGGGAIDPPPPATDDAGKPDRDK